VARKLKEHGVEQVMALKGGWNAWKEGGYPVEPK
jgi:rhodanese-related sulfurtransferase